MKDELSYSANHVYREGYNDGHNDGVKYGKEELLDYLICRIDGFLDNKETTPEMAMAFCLVMAILKEQEAQANDSSRID